MTNLTVFTGQELRVETDTDVIYFTRRVTETSEHWLITDMAHEFRGTARIERGYLTVVVDGVQVYQNTIGPYPLTFENDEHRERMLTMVARKHITSKV